MKELMNLVSSVEELIDEFAGASPLPEEAAKSVAQSLAKKRRSTDSLNGVLCCIPSDEGMKELVKHIQENEHQIVVEVGAGYGLLAVALRQSGYLSGVEYRATDLRPCRDWVERLDHQAAVAQYQPSLVICAWPPILKGSRERSWPWIWATYTCVREYILIGPWPHGRGLLVGDLFSDYPPGWYRCYLPQLSHRLLDLYGNISKAYSFHRV